MINHQAIAHIADHIVMKKNQMGESAANHMEEVIVNHMMMSMGNQAAEKIEKHVMMIGKNQIVEITENHMADAADTKFTKVKKIS